MGLFMGSTQFNITYLNELDFKYSTLYGVEVIMIYNPFDRNIKKKKF